MVLFLFLYLLVTINLGYIIIESESHYYRDFRFWFALFALFVLIALTIKG
jgi:hypothetical protein